MSDAGGDGVKVDVTHAILAVITDEESAIEPGWAPVFRIRDEGERQRVAQYIGTITLGMVHDLRNGTYLVVKH